MVGSTTAVRGGREANISRTASSNAAMPTTALSLGLSNHESTLTTESAFRAGAGLS